MKTKRIYYRKKGKSIIIEGKNKGKSIYLWTLPKDAEFFLKKIISASFFTKEKAQKLMTLLDCLDYKTKSNNEVA